MDRAFSLVENGTKQNPSKKAKISNNTVCIGKDAEQWCKTTNIIVVDTVLYPVRWRKQIAETLQIKRNEIIVLKGTDEESMRKDWYTISAETSILKLWLTWDKVAVIWSQIYFMSWQM